MKDFKDAVALITGAASGIGLMLAHEAAKRGMKVAIGDIREEALRNAENELREAGGDVLAMHVDVTKAASVAAFAEATVARFGKLNLLINNAGAFVAGLTWDIPLEQYDWVIDLNFKSAIYGVRACVPRMIAQGDPCHVVTIASAAAMTVYPGYAMYSSTKHAALALSEALYPDLAAEGIKNIGVTIAMPGMVRTDIMTPEKGSPQSLKLDRHSRFQNRTVRSMERLMVAQIESAMAPAELACRVFEAISADQLYVLPNNDSAGHQAISQSVGVGRATGINPFEPILKGILEIMAHVDAKP